jgi:hypothetical protein
MKPVRAIKNQFRGINPHLHSLWQGVGNWQEFHFNHISALVAVLKAKLIPMGYTAKVEDSLQIRHHRDTPKYPESDATVYDLVPERALRTVQPPVMVAEYASEVALAKLIGLEEAEESEYRAIGVYEIVPRDNAPGEPVAWIELLSPTNKTLHLTEYRKRRYKLLDAGMVFIELDYLHETSPTYRSIANYTKGEPNSSAYSIIVCDPRPLIIDGISYVYAIKVDQALPPVAIPLNGKDVLKFDFNVPYQKTFTELLYGIELVDYRQLPINFERYSPDDRARIANRMVSILEAAQRGADLEQVTLEDCTLPLDEALAKIEALNQAAA